MKEIAWFESAYKKPLMTFYFFIYANIFDTQLLRARLLADMLQCHIASLTPTSHWAWEI